MTRAARGASPAVFKVIRNGGCRSPAQLRNQLDYVGTKAALVFDSRGLLDGRQGLGRTEVDEAARRLTADWRAGHQLRLGHTAHLLMSFPIGTPPGIAGAVAEAVCSGAFQRQGAHFDYVAALHTDRAHPHVHVVVNRHSLEGALLTLRPDGPYSYQAFREAMVEHAARHGVALEATRRLDRGKLTYAATDAEVRRARDRGHAPTERRRQSRDFDGALQAVVRAGSAYQGLALDARRAGFDSVGEDLRRASAVLARGEIILPRASAKVAPDTQAFVSIIGTLLTSARQVEGRVAAASPAERPWLEQGLSKVMAAMPHLAPFAESRNSRDTYPPPVRESVEPRPTTSLSRAVAALSGVRSRLVAALGRDDSSTQARLVRTARRQGPSDPLTTVAGRLRHADPHERAFGSPTEAKAFRRELEARLGSKEAARLARGQTDALARVADHLIDRLTLTNAYLQARSEPEASPIHRAIAQGIAQAQLASKRERLRDDDGGHVHD